MNKHTPGPWTTYEHSQGIDVIVDDGADGTSIATCWQSDNARLIAAAPALLATLERIANYPNADAGIVVAAREAIHQATGE